MTRCGPRDTLYPGSPTRAAQGPHAPPPCHSPLRVWTRYVCVFWLNFRILQVVHLNLLRRASGEGSTAVAPPFLRGVKGDTQSSLRAFQKVPAWPRPGSSHSVDVEEAPGGRGEIGTTFPWIPAKGVCFTVRWDRVSIPLVPQSKQRQKNTILISYFVNNRDKGKRCAFQSSLCPTPRN